MKKLSPEEKEELQQKIREYHQDRVMRVAGEAGQLSPEVSILVVILSVGIAVGSLVFMWQFLMDVLASHPLLTSIFFVVWLSLALAIAWCWWLGTGLNRLWRVILRLLFASAVAVIVTVFFLALPDYGHWAGAWEGRVTKKYTYKKYTRYDDWGEERTYFVVDLTTHRRQHLPHRAWKRVKVGNYIVKKGRSYTIEIRQKPSSGFTISSKRLPNSAPLP